MVDRGCEIAPATIEDADSLAAAFQGMEGVFVLVPPNFDPLPDFTEAHTIAKTLHAALLKARPAQSRLSFNYWRAGKQQNLLTQHPIHAAGHRTIARFVNFLAPGVVHGKFKLGWTPPSRGVIPGFTVQPLDKPVPMVATADIGRVAAELLQENWSEVWCGGT